MTIEREGIMKMIFGFIAVLFSSSVFADGIVEVTNFSETPLTLYPTQYTPAGFQSFGSVKVGFSSLRVIYVRNNSTKEVDVRSSYVFGSGFSGGGCYPSRLFPGGSCSVMVTFRPIFEGYQSGTLSVYFSDGQSEIISLSGFGTK
jgi:hypothetical protein